MAHWRLWLHVKYIKSVLWRVAKRLSYIEEVRCLKVIKQKVYEFDVHVTTVHRVKFLIIKPTADPSGRAV